MTLLSHFMTLLFSLSSYYWYMLANLKSWHSYDPSTETGLSWDFIRVLCTLNRVSCHHLRWCGTGLMRREMKWVLSRLNHVCTVTNIWWVLELNRMRAYEIANIKQCIVVWVSFIVSELFGLEPTSATGLVAWPNLRRTKRPPHLWWKLTKERAVESCGSQNWITYQTLAKFPWRP